MRTQNDRRVCVRHSAQTLMLEVDDLLHPLIDISTGGLGFEGRGFRPGQQVGLRIYSALDNDDVIDAPGEIRNIQGVRVGALFTHPNLVLFQYVISHIANLTKVTPYLLRRRHIA